MCQRNEQYSVEKKIWENKEMLNIHFEIKLSAFGHTF